MNFKKIKWLSVCLTAMLFIECSSSDKKNSEVGLIENPEDRIEQLNKEILKGKKDANLYFERAREYDSKGEFQNALKDMFVTMKIDSMNPDYYVFGADLFLKTSQSAKALALLKNAKEKFPENHDLALKYAEMQITLNQLQDAVRTVDGVMYRDNQNPRAFFLMGYIMILSEDFDKAKLALKEAVRLDPEITDAYLLLAELYEKDNPKLALQYLENAIIVSPNTPETHHNKAFFLQNNDDISGALEVYDQIKIRFPQYSSAFLNSGILYIELDSLNLAYENFNILSKIKPQSHLAYFYRGYSSELMGKLEEAKKDYEQALRINPDYQKAIHQLDKLKTKDVIE